MAGIGPIISGGKALARSGLPLLLVLACACSAPRFQWEGAWRGERPIPKEIDDPVIARTLARVEVTLHANGTFDLFEAGIPKSGVYRIVGGEALLKVKEFLNRPIAEQGSSAEAMNEEIRLKALPEGALLYSDPRGFDAAPIRLERLPATPPDTSS